MCLQLSGWGYDSSNQPSPVLLTANLTFTTYGTCLNLYSLEDRLHITLDKVCGGDVIGKSDERKITKIAKLQLIWNTFVPAGPGARRGDSGGGYVFLHPTSGRYYLRGIVSARVLNASTSLFTDVLFPDHVKWLESNLQEIENRKMKK